LWSAVLDASSLFPGVYFRLCTDTDGSDGTLPPGASGIEIYVPALVLVTHTLLSAPNQEIVVKCNITTGCSKATEVFLSSMGCEDQLLPPPRKRTHTADFKSNTTSAWYYSVDASTLERGIHVVLCEDVDGDSGPSRKGQSSGGTVYISGVDIAEQVTLRRRQEQFLALECPVGCSTMTEAFLATSCDFPAEGRKTPSAKIFGATPYFTLQSMHGPWNQACIIVCAPISMDLRCLIYVQAPHLVQNPSLQAWKLC
jgi:hypothetical protein